MVGFWVWRFCFNVQKCHAQMGGTHQNEVRKMEDASVFMPVHSCCLSVYMYMCVSTHVWVCDTWSAMSFGCLLEAGLLLCHLLGRLYKGQPPWSIFVSFSLFPTLCFHPSHHMLMAHIIFPFHHPKNKISLDFSSDFSLSLDEVPAIYIFVCRREWGTYK